MKKMRVNRHDVFGEDNENENTECEEKIAMQKTRETDYEILNDVNCNKASKRNNKNEIEEK